MKRFIIEQCDEELYTVHTGLALVGLCLNRFTAMDRQLARRVRRCRGVSHADVRKKRSSGSTRVMGYVSSSTVNSRVTWT